LTDDDKRHVSRLAIGTIVDLRTDREMKAEATRWPHPVTVRAFGAALENDAAHLQMGWNEDTNVADVKAFMQETYRTMHQWLGPHIGAIFNAVLETDDPVLFHCTAGKDRTGVCAAIILTVLGVSRNTIIADYELTNHSVDLYEFSKHHWATAGDQGAAHPLEQLPCHVREVLVSADSAFIDAALQSIAEMHGGVAGYLGEVVGVDAAAIASFRQKLLTSAVS
jgi:Protein tyrosine/serine phosphatase